ncbi:MAG: hypothetical protein ACRD2X_04685, partial [Vicinamibacteraceae bacterium]
MKRAAYLSLVAIVPIFSVWIGTRGRAPVASAAASAIPRTADGKPDFSGIWQTLSAADYDLEPHSGRIDAPPGPGIVK